MHCADERVGADPVLEQRGGDVLAAGGDDDLLLAAGDPQVAVLVELAEVAGVEPAVDDRLGGRGRVVAVPAQTLTPCSEDLAVVRDPDAAAGQRLADRADLDPLRDVDRGRRGGLGEAVALEDGEADAAEEVAEPLAERGAAGHRVLDLPADGGRAA